MPKHRELTLHDRLAVGSRVLAAVAGGYAFASAAALVLTLVLPLPRPDAVLAATLTSFALYAAAVLWVFAARSAAAAWLGLLVPTGAFVLLWLAAAPG